MTTVPVTTLFLSRLILNPRSRQVMSEMAHPYEMHRTLMRAFPEATDITKAKARDEFGVLFRADVDEKRGIIKAYVQSRIEPDWSFLDRLDDYLSTDTEMPAYEHKDIMPAYRKIQSGQVLSFRLRANPTKRIGKQDDPMKGKRVELRDENEQTDWLIRKGQAMGEDLPGGFDLLMKEVRDAKGEIRLIPRVNVCCDGKQTGRTKDGHSAMHFAVLYDGLLRVTDTNAFLQTLISGIGAGKAFGFGLLTIAPTR